MDEILALPPENRAELVQVICESLEGDPNSDLSAEQLVALKRYLDEFRRDPDNAVPWEQVRAQVFRSA